MAIDALSVSVAEEKNNGLSAEILQAIAKKLDTRLVFLYAPFARRLYMMKSGTIDLMTGLLKRPEREEYIYFIQPPYRLGSDTVFFVPGGKSALIQTYDDLYPLSIGTTLESKYFLRFDGDNTLNKEPVSNVSFNFKKLLLGRLDTVIYAEGPGIEKIHKMGMADKIEMAQFRFSHEKKPISAFQKNPL
ncbi:substrate-binding periplasmic protein [Desulfospira joergensenii]|uniref:substrate-binding periplasmic protein n=1 Tax=Desulfospira joergensenii TaxID=53329 RepID=UPI0003B70169|nr:transporter substrate-binding domain-containing protein [Desulfospira joergensenii]